MDISRSSFIVFSISLISILSITSCFDKQQQQQQQQINTVDYYSKNIEERVKTIKQCSDNPGELKNTPNCVNAIKAETLASSGNLKKISW
ncbi:MAG: EexN family lipoprotein [Plesiomonas sp.]|uniref:EexN family lipoprotein n=1 Tax=Plesiomonas sp. TaxID=2486279 RepID=UPI003F31B9B4